ncbi:MAG: hypothetical protein AABX07_03095 [Nanoarchaeota archaeon]
MNIIKNKRGFEFSFGWLFAIIIGSAAIFIAFYFASDMLNLLKKQENTIVGKQFDILLYPAGTGLEEDKITLISFPVATKLFFECIPSGDFGEQRIKTSVSSTMGAKYQEDAINSRSSDKYIFSQTPLEGKEFLAFVKPFNMPFKVTDLIFIIQKGAQYCIVLAPDALAEDIEKLKEQNNLNSTFFLAETYETCPKASRKLCFASSRDKRCEIQVIGDKIIMGDKSFYYDSNLEDNSLLYGALFAAPEIYECQLKRLLKRASELSLLYLNKGASLSSTGCTSGLEQDLMQYSNTLKAINNTPSDLNNIFTMSKEIGRKNNDLSCPLF